MTTNKTETQPSKVRTNFESIKEWLLNHQGDVDFSAFRAAAYSLIHLVYMDKMQRVPAFLRNAHPMDMMDFVAAELRESLSCEFSEMPVARGSKFVREE